MNTSFHNNMNTSTVPLATASSSSSSHYHGSESGVSSYLHQLRQMRASREHVHQQQQPNTNFDSLRSFYAQRSESPYALTGANTSGMGIGADGGGAVGRTNSSSQRAILTAPPPQMMTSSAVAYLHNSVLTAKTAAGITQSAAAGGSSLYRTSSYGAPTTSTSAAPPTSNGWMSRPYNHHQHPVGEDGNGVIPSRTPRTQSPLNHHPATSSTNTPNGNTTLMNTNSTCIRHAFERDPVSSMRFPTHYDRNAAAYLPSASTSVGAAGGSNSNVADPRPPEASPFIPPTYTQRLDPHSKEAIARVNDDVTAHVLSIHARNLIDREARQQYDLRREQQKLEEQRNHRQRAEVEHQHRMLTLRQRLAEKDEDIRASRQQLLEGKLGGVGGGGAARQQLTASPPPLPLHPSVNTTNSSSRPTTPVTTTSSRHPPPTSSVTAETPANPPTAATTTTTAQPIIAQPYVKIPLSHYEPQPPMRTDDEGVPHPLHRHEQQEEEETSFSADRMASHQHLQSVEQQQEVRASPSHSSASLASPPTSPLTLGQMLAKAQANAFAVLGNANRALNGAGGVAHVGGGGEGAPAVPMGLPNNALTNNMYGGPAAIGITSGTPYNSLPTPNDLTAYYKGAFPHVADAMGVGDATSITSRHAATSSPPRSPTAMVSMTMPSPINASIGGNGRTLVSPPRTPSGYRMLASGTDANKFSGSSSSSTMVGSPPMLLASTADTIAQSSPKQLGHHTTTGTDHLMPPGARAQLLLAALERSSSLYNYNNSSSSPLGASSSGGGMDGIPMLSSRASSFNASITAQQHTTHAGGARQALLPNPDTSYATIKPPLAAQQRISLQHGSQSVISINNNDCEEASFRSSAHQHHHPLTYSSPMRMPASPYASSSSLSKRNDYHQLQNNNRDAALNASFRNQHPQREAWQLERLVIEADEAAVRKGHEDRIIEALADVHRLVRRLMEVTMVRDITARQQQQKQPLLRAANEYELHPLPSIKGRASNNLLITVGTQTPPRSRSPAGPPLQILPPHPLPLQAAAHTPHLQADDDDDLITDGDEAFGDMVIDHENDEEENGKVSPMSTSAGGGSVGGDAEEENTPAPPYIDFAALLKEIETVEYDVRQHFFTEAKAYIEELYFEGYVFGAQQLMLQLTESKARSHYLTQESVAFCEILGMIAVLLGIDLTPYNRLDKNALVAAKDLFATDALRIRSEILSREEFAGRRNVEAHEVEGWRQLQRVSKIKLAEVITRGLAASLRRVADEEEPLARRIIVAEEATAILALGEVFTDLNDSVGRLAAFTTMLMETETRRRREIVETEDDALATIKASATRLLTHLSELLSIKEAEDSKRQQEALFGQQRDELIGLESRQRQTIAGEHENMLAMLSAKASTDKRNAAQLTRVIAAQDHFLRQEDYMRQQLVRAEDESFDNLLGRHVKDFDDLLALLTLHLLCEQIEQHESLGRGGIEEAYVASIGGIVQWRNDGIATITAILTERDAAAAKEKLLRLFEEQRVDFTDRIESQLRADLSHTADTECAAILTQMISERAQLIASIKHSTERATVEDREASQRRLIEEANDTLRKGLVADHESSFERLVEKMILQLSCEQLSSHEAHVRENIIDDESADRSAYDQYHTEVIAELHRITSMRAMEEAYAAYQIQQHNDREAFEAVEKAQRDEISDAEEQTLVHHFTAMWDERKWIIAKVQHTQAVESLFAAEFSQRAAIINAHQQTLQTIITAHTNALEALEVYLGFVKRCDVFGKQETEARTVLVSAEEDQLTSITRDYYANMCLVECNDLASEESFERTHFTSPQHSRYTASWLHHLFEGILIAEVEEREHITRSNITKNEYQKGLAHITQLISESLFSVEQHESFVQSIHSLVKKEAMLREELLRSEENEVVLNDFVFYGKRLHTAAVRQAAMRSQMKDLFSEEDTARNDLVGLCWGELGNILVTTTQRAAAINDAAALKLAVDTLMTREATIRQQIAVDAEALWGDAVGGFISQLQKLARLQHYKCELNDIEADEAHQRKSIIILAEAAAWRAIGTSITDDLANIRHKVQIATLRASETTRRRIIESDEDFAAAALVSIAASISTQHRRWMRWVSLLDDCITEERKERDGIIGAEDDSLNHIINRRRDDLYALRTNEFLRFAVDQIESDEKLERQSISAAEESTRYQGITRVAAEALRHIKGIEAHHALLQRLVAQEEAERSDIANDEDSQRVFMVTALHRSLDASGKASARSFFCDEEERSRRDTLMHPESREWAALVTTYTRETDSLRADTSFRAALAHLQEAEHRERLLIDTNALSFYTTNNSLADAFRRGIDAINNKQHVLEALLELQHNESVGRLTIIRQEADAAYELRSQSFSLAQLAQHDAIMRGMLDDIESHEARERSLLYNDEANSYQNQLFVTYQHLRTAANVDAIVREGLQRLQMEESEERFQNIIPNESSAREHLMGRFDDIAQNIATHEHHVRKMLSTISLDEAMARNRIETEEVHARTDIRRLEIEGKTTTERLMQARLAAEERRRLAESKSANPLAEPADARQKLVRKTTSMRSMGGLDPNNKPSDRMPSVGSRSASLYHMPYNSRSSPSPHNASQARIIPHHRVYSIATDVDGLMTSGVGDPSSSPPMVSHRTSFIVPTMSNDGFGKDHSFSGASPAPLANHSAYVFPTEFTDDEDKANNNTDGNPQHQHHVQYLASTVGPHQAPPGEAETHQHPPTTSLQVALLAEQEPSPPAINDDFFVIHSNRHPRGASSSKTVWPPAGSVFTVGSSAGSPSPTRDVSRYHHTGMSPNTAAMMKRRSSALLHENTIYASPRSLEGYGRAGRRSLSAGSRGGANTSNPTSRSVSQGSVVRHGDQSLMLMMGDSAAHSRHTSVSFTSPIYLTGGSRHRPIVGPTTDLGPISPEERMQLCDEYIADVERKERLLIEADENTSYKALLWHIDVSGKAVGLTMTMMTRAASYGSTAASGFVAAGSGGGGVRRMPMRLSITQQPTSGREASLHPMTSSAAGSPNILHPPSMGKGPAGGGSNVTRRAVGDVSTMMVSVGGVGANNNDIQRSLFPPIGSVGSSGATPSSSLSPLITVKRYDSTNVPPYDRNTPLYGKYVPAEVLKTEGNSPSPTPLSVSAIHPTTTNVSAISDQMGGGGGHIPPNHRPPPQRKVLAYGGTLTATTSPDAHNYHSDPSAAVHYTPSEVPVPTRPSVNQRAATHDNAYAEGSMAPSMDGDTSMFSPNGAHGSNPYLPRWSFGVKLTEVMIMLGEAEDTPTPCLKVVKALPPASPHLAHGDLVLAVDGQIVTTQTSVREATAMSADGLVEFTICVSATGDIRRVLIQGTRK